MINDTISVVTDPLGEAFGDLMGLLMKIVGGLFGLYVIYTIFLIFKWKETRQLKKTVKKMEKDIKDIKYIVENTPQPISQKTKSEPKKKASSKAH